MRFFGLQSLRRNWHIGIFGIFVTIGLLVAAARLVPAKYVATTQMVLVPPLSQRSTSYSGVVNPYMNLAGLQSMADVVSRAMMDDETAQALKKAGVSQYKVSYDALSAGPILIAEADASSPKKASDALAVLTRQVPLAVARLQGAAAISPRSFIHVAVIAGPSTPVKSSKTQLRAIAVSLVGGLVLTLLAVSFIDAWRIRRRLQGFATGDSDYPVETSSTYVEPRGSMTQQGPPGEQTPTEAAHLEFNSATEKLRTAAASLPSVDSDDEVAVI